MYVTERVRFCLVVMLVWVLPCPEVPLKPQFLTATSRPVLMSFLMDDSLSCRVYRYVSV